MSEDSILIWIGSIGTAGTIVCAIFGYLTWRQSQRPPKGASVKPAPRSGWFTAAAVLGTGALYCLGYLLYVWLRASRPYILFAAITAICVLIAAIWVTLFRFPAAAESKLKINRAIWGDGHGAQIDVTDKLAATARDALVIDVIYRNPALGDPAPFKPKRLDIEYSYGTEILHAYVSRGEVSRLVLPEDSELERLKGEVLRLKQEGELATQAVAEEPIISDDQRKQIKLAGIVESKAGQAEWLAGDLERIWHLFNNANQKLIYPLKEHTVPDPATEFWDKELWAFRIRYRWHVGGLKSHVPPDFHSDIMDAPPFWNVEYLVLLRKLKEHAEALRKLARSLESRSEQSFPSIGLTDGICNPLQIEAIQLSTDLLELLRRLGEPPAPKYTRKQLDDMSSTEMRRLIDAQDGDFAEATAYHYKDPRFFIQTAEGVYNQILAHCNRLFPWYEKVRASYALEFEERVKRLHNRLSVEGISDSNLLVAVEGFKGDETIRSIAATCWELAYKVGERERNGQ